MTIISIQIAAAMKTEAEVTPTIPSMTYYHYARRQKR
jgi:hypothetical protein